MSGESEREIEADAGADKNSSAREAAACNYALGRVAERASSNSVPDNRENNRVDRPVDGGIEIERERDARRSRLRTKNSEFRFRDRGKKAGHRWDESCQLPRRQFPAPGLLRPERGFRYISFVVIAAFRRSETRSEGSEATSFCTEGFCFDEISTKMSTRRGLELIGRNSRLPIRVDE